MLYAPIITAVLGLCAVVDAQITPLGAAGAYGVFAGSTITNTGLTTINAKIGLSPGSSITGFPPGQNTGEDIDNGAATAAAADIAATYASLAALPFTTDLTGQDLGGQTLGPGVYKFSSSAQLTGILTLDGQGNPDATFVFQIGSTLTTATAASVVLIDGALACNVYWQVGSSATLGTATIFAGNVLAEASITVTTGVSLVGGGFYAITAAVTLDDNIIDPLGACGGSTVPPPPSSTTSTATASPTLATITTTSTVTNPASTTTITVTVSTTATVTDTVATSYTTCTSTSTSYSTKSTTKTASPTLCPTAAKAAKAKRGAHTKTVTTTCAGHTSTHTKAPATHTKKTTCTSTSTHWKTTTGTTTHTSTHTPACTSSSKAKRDYGRLFE